MFNNKKLSDKEAYWDANKKLPQTEYIASLPKKRISAEVLFRDKDNRILLLEPTYQWNFVLPGGVVEAHESPWAAAAREVSEELGWHKPLGRLLVVDAVRPYDSFPEKISFVFDGGILDETDLSTISLDTTETESAGFYELTVAQTKVKPLHANRLKSALEAIALRGVVLCDNGVRSNQ